MWCPGRRMTLTRLRRSQFGCLSRGQKQCHPRVHRNFPEPWRWLPLPPGRSLPVNKDHLGNSLVEVC